MSDKLERFIELIIALSTEKTSPVEDKECATLKSEITQALEDSKILNDLKQRDVYLPAKNGYTANIDFQTLIMINEELLKENQELKQKLEKTKMIWTSRRFSNEVDDLVELDKILKEIPMDEYVSPCIHKTESDLKLHILACVEPESSRWNRNYTERAEWYLLWRDELKND